MKCTVQIGRAVDQYQLAGRGIHQSVCRPRCGLCCRCRCAVALLRLRGGLGHGGIGLFTRRGRSRLRAFTCHLRFVFRKIQWPTQAATSKHQRGGQRDKERLNGGFHRGGSVGGGSVKSRREGPSIVSGVPIVGRSRRLASRCCRGKPLSHWVTLCVSLLWTQWRNASGG